MNFSGTIRYIMASSGLSDAFELVYASNTVTHLLTGKAVNCALRAHQLVDTALSGILLREICSSKSINVEPLQHIISQVLAGN